MEVLCYRDLKVWSLGMDLVQTVYELSTAFPKAEIYALSSQLQRAAVSIPSNIAEGHARGTKEFIHFISISLGSLAELETQLLIAQRLKYVDNTTLVPVFGLCEDLGKMLRALQRSLKQKCGI